MRDIDQDIRNSLERLTDPHEDPRGTDALWGDLVDRRRKRRNRNRALAALPVLLVAVLAVGVLSAQGSDDGRSDVAAGGADTASSDGAEPTGTARPTVKVESYGELREHLASLTEGMPDDVLPEVVVPIQPPDGWTLETAGGDWPSDYSRSTIYFDYIDMSSTRQPIPTVSIATTTLAEPNVCTSEDDAVSIERIATTDNYVACLTGTPEDVAAWSDVEWTTIARPTSSRPGASEAAPTEPNQLGGGPDTLTAAIEAATSPAYDFELVSATEAGSDADLAEVHFLLDGVSVKAVRQSYDERPPDEALAADNPYEVEVLPDGSELIVIEADIFNQAILFDADGVMTNLVSSSQPGGASSRLPAAALRDIVLRIAELDDGS